MNMKNCTQCSTSFEVTPKQQEGYDRLQVKTPSICPQCGVQRMMALRNERNLFRRACDKCAKEGLSLYHPKAPYVVWCHECWWKDDWSGKDYAQNYDPSRPIFDQLKELQAKVPREALITVNSINSDYGNNIRDSKDVYFCFLVALAENVLYSMWITSAARDILDSYKVVGGERSAFSIDISKCSYSAYLQDCVDSTNCYFSYDLKGCNNCLFSSGLRNKSYYVRNKQVSKEEFEAEKKKVLNGSWATLLGSLKEFSEIKKHAIRRYANMLKSSNVVGNYVEGCGESTWCFEGLNTERSHAIASVLFAKESTYCYSLGTQPVEFTHGSSVIKGGSNIRFCFNTLTSNNCTLSDSLISSSECIASVGLKHGEYSILNKQYSKEEYEAIKKSLEERGELSDFPPPSFSTFAYNETAANDFYPLTKEEALKLGFTWQDDFQMTTGKETLQPENIPDTIENIQDSILKEVLRCITCNRNYRIVPRELDLLKSFPLPIPRECPFCRMAGRRRERRPFTLWHRTCMCDKANHKHEGKCQNEFETSYAPERPEIVYCESCYQAEVV